MTPTELLTRQKEVGEYAIKVFDDDQRAIKWFRKPCTSLNGKSPISLMVSEEGINKVNNVLEKISETMTEDYGVDPKNAKV